MYQLYGVVMLALEMYSPTLDRSRVVLHPSGLKLPDTTRYRVYAYVLARTPLHAERVSHHVGMETTLHFTRFGSG